MELRDWAVLIGMVIQLAAVVKLAFSVGKWQGEIDTKIGDVIKRLDNFDKRYGDLPERVAYLEGCLREESK